MTRLWAVVFASGLLVGCSTRTVTSTPRSAIEQLLLSRAVDKALARFDMPELRGRKVHADFANLQCTDADYVKVALRARMAEQGATLVAAGDKPDYTVEVASGALAMELKKGMVGLPEFPVPQSPVGTPEAPLYRKIEQTAIVKLLIFVHTGGRFVAAEQFYAKADRDESFILWYRFQTKDEVREGWEQADERLQVRQEQQQDKQEGQPK
jgi:hypothetical protein